MVNRDNDPEVELAILRSLDGLLQALALEPAGEDRFRVAGEPGRFDRIFGGQLIAQALLATCATVTGKDPHSLHAYFVDGGTPGEGLDIAVERVRDGRSISTRRASVMQAGRTLLILMASFHTNPVTPELTDPPPHVPPPDQMPTLQQWVETLPPELVRHARSWVDTPPPLNLRIGEPPTFLAARPAEGVPADGARSHWMRLPRGVGAEPTLHAALLAYASDYLLLDMAFRSHPDGFSPNTMSATSLDHAVWLHRPVRFDRWHLHSQRTLAISGHRGLVRGMIHDTDGHLVASVIQEVLVRPRPS
jgi:acyl-CoA thioesterase-2